MGGRDDVSGGGWRLGLRRPPVRPSQRAPCSGTARTCSDDSPTLPPPRVRNGCAGRQPRGPTDRVPAADSLACAARSTGEAFPRWPVTAAWDLPAAGGLVHERTRRTVVRAHHHRRRVGSSVVHHHPRIRRAWPLLESLRERSPLWDDELSEKNKLTGPRRRGSATAGPRAATPA